MAASDQVAKSVKRKLARRQCLGCGRRVASDEKLKLGQCTTCYGGTYRALRDGTADREQLLAEGLIAEQPRGRRPANEYTRALRARKCSSK